MISTPRDIGREWRLFVAGDEIVSHSQYAIRGEKAVDADCPANVLQFGSSVLRDSNWRPAPLFTMDVCESEGELRLVELNGFSCSNLYQCELEPLVTAVAFAASWA